jgi:DNA-directed RNA polymerase sigma subunit (sigma70/sigma32)
MEASVAAVLDLFDLQQGMHMASLDVQIGEHEEDTLANLLETDPEQTPEHMTFLQSRNEQIERLLSLLTKEERQVILLRYGLRDGEEQTYGDIVKCMHVGLDRVHTLEQRAILKMRRLAALKQLQDFID